MWRGRLAFLIVPILLSLGCVTSTYDREFIEVEDSYYTGGYDEALLKTRDLATTAGRKNLLLYSMEAGVIFHTMGDIESSDLAFRQADELAGKLSRSSLEEIATFVLNETEKKFLGQNFERVLIKYYLALNRLVSGDLENAKVYFRQIDYELRDMKFFDELYKQNAASRYLDAVVSEQLGEYNDARVQLKNLQEMFPHLEQEIGAARYVLAVKEGSKEDLEAFGKWAEAIPAFNREGEAVPYSEGMAEIVLINYAGQSAVKSSRGRVSEEPRILGAFERSLATNPNRQVSESVGHVLRILRDAENPIPEYVRRDPVGSNRVEVSLQGDRIGSTVPFFSYSETAMRHFNDHYDEMIERNIDAFTARIVASLMTGQAMAGLAQGLNQAAAAQGSTESISVEEARNAGVLIAASQIYQTIAPDLRCWRLLPDNYQILRIFVEPGSYDLGITPPEPARSTWKGERLILGTGDIRFITFQTMSEDRHRYRLASAR